jgi:hypothetical protein
MHELIYKSMPNLCAQGCASAVHTCMSSIREGGKGEREKGGGGGGGEEREKNNFLIILFHQNLPSLEYKRCLSRLTD